MDRTEPNKSVVRSISFNPEGYENKRTFWNKFKLYKTDPFYVLGACITTGLICRAFGIESWVNRAITFAPISLVTLMVRDIRSGEYDDYLGELGGIVGQMHWDKVCQKHSGEPESHFSQVSIKYLNIGDKALEKGLNPGVCRGLVSAWLDNGDADRFESTFFERAVSYQEKHKNKAYMFTMLDDFSGSGLENLVEGEFKEVGFEVFTIQESEVANPNKDNVLDTGSKHQYIRIQPDSEGVVIRGKELDDMVSAMEKTDRAFVFLIDNNKGHVLGIKLYSDGVYLFDPNFGIYKVPKSNFGTFMEDAFKDLAYKINVAFIAPLTPPKANT